VTLTSLNLRSISQLSPHLSVDPGAGNTLRLLLHELGPISAAPLDLDANGPGAASPPDSSHGEHPRALLFPLR